jgi:hypothetical protein
MTIDRSKFFDAIRSAPFSGTLTQPQVGGISNILDEWERRLPTGDLRFLAYMLATVYHETAAEMQPIRERGSPEYLQMKPYYPWVGMGLVQVTWEGNARKFGARKPEDLLSWPIALEALFRGMAEGMFTGRKLADYFNATTDDPVSARRIINGMDRAAIIAGYHKRFLLALMAAKSGAPLVSAPRQSDPRVTSAPAKTGFWSSILSIFRKAA